MTVIRAQAVLRFIAIVFVMVFPCRHALSVNQNATTFIVSVAVHFVFLANMAYKPARFAKSQSETVLTSINKIDLILSIERTAHMFNIPSDPWYNYMQPFRIALLKQIIKARQTDEKKQQEQKSLTQAQQEKS